MAKVVLRPPISSTLGLITGLRQLVLCVLLYGWTNTAASAGHFLIVWLGGITAIWTATGWAGMYLLDQDGATGTQIIDWYF
jgi:hypothetical protein